MGEQSLPAAVILDVDGTLVESERYGHRVAFNQAFEDFDMPDRWDEETYGRLLEVSGGENRLRHYLLESGYEQDEAEELAARLHSRKNEHFIRLAEEGEIPERPGAGRLIDEVAEAGVPIAVATTGSREWVEPLLERLFGLERFKVILTGDDVSDRKPDPEVFHEALALLEVNAADTVAIEDSRNGLDAALAAEIPCLIVVGDYNQDQDFDGAALVVDSFGAREGSEAELIAGPSDALEDGMITLATLRRIVGEEPS
ncbi:MAG: HAD-IA family hydrolase [Actinomycetota bacterium]|nr:HAD-IA family hydrolase [Actinomycetota bacterium]